MQIVLVYKALWSLHREWKKYGTGAEVSWFLRGVDASINKIKQMDKLQRIRGAKYNPRINYATAKGMFRAILRAQNELERGDRRKALETLRKATAAIRMSPLNAKLFNQDTVTVYSHPLKEIA